MSSVLSGPAIAPGLSICLYCGSSNTARPEYLAAATAFGREMAAAGARLVYGGGGIGLMGAAAKAAQAAGGRVLGVMPAFLRRHEVVYDEVETVIVETMHQRKMRMFEEADGFAVFPGGIGTLEEVVELMSWRRLDLHRKPIVFYNPDRFWDPLFALIHHMIEERVAPGWMPDTWATVSTVADVIPAVQRLRATAERGPGFHGYDPDAEVKAKG